MQTYKRIAGIFFSSFFFSNYINSCSIPTFINQIEIEWLKPFQKSNYPHKRQLCRTLINAYLPTLWSLHTSPIIVCVTWLIWYPRKKKSHDYSSYEYHLCHKHTCPRKYAKEQENNHDSTKRAASTHTLWLYLTTHKINVNYFYFLLPAAAAMRHPHLTKKIKTPSVFRFFLLLLFYSVKQICSCIWTFSFR